jgi:di/tricarboxylate transporter
VITVTALDLWVVPAIAMVLLFLLPVRWKTREMTLETGDFQNGVQWNIIFLVVSGTAMATALAGLGVAEWLGGLIENSVSSAALPWFAGLVTPVLSHLTSGTATTSMVSTVLFPVAESLGYNPAILARIIAGTALAVSLPWAGAASSTAFASGTISFGDMFRIGVVATVFTTIAITLLSMVLVPALGAYSSF